MAVTYIITGILMGIVFGFALERGRVFEPGVLVGQFQLRNFLLAKVFLSAAATTLVVLAVLNGIAGVELGPKPAVFPAVILGGLMFGMGMALAGACPGTVMAQIGAGYRDAWFVLIGAVFGAMGYGYMQPVLNSVNTSMGKVSLAHALGAPFWVIALVAAAVIAFLLAVLEKRKPWREELGEDVDGHFPE
ncbi:MAG: YeeE/YedE thiosulfate transporter family protein [Desulfonatronovibrionaceae bacterium]